MEAKTTNVFSVLRTIAIICGCVAVLLAGLCIITTTTDNNSAFPFEKAIIQEKSKPALPIEQGAGAYDSSAGKELYSNEPGVEIPGWGKIEIMADKTDINSVDFFNPETNETYYLSFELRLPDSSSQGYEVVYKSGLVEPGKHLQHITLNRPLSAGEYDAVVFVQPYRIKDQSMTNSAEMGTKLVVISR